MKIALTGKVRSGKDTVKDYLIEKYGMVPFAFGDDLKKGFHEAYPHIPEHPKPVRGYQLYGQLMRYVHKDTHWIDNCFKKIDYIADVAKNYNITGSEIDFRPVITDVRQDNEVDRCKEEGFVLIRVNCPDEIRLERMNATGDNFTLADLQFETETAVDHFEVDYDIENGGTLEELYLQIEDVIQKIRGS